MYTVCMAYLLLQWLLAMRADWPRVIQVEGAGRGHQGRGGGQRVSREAACGSEGSQGCLLNYLLVVEAIPHPH